MLQVNFKRDQSHPANDSEHILLHPTGCLGHHMDNSGKDT